MRYDVVIPTAGRASLQRLLEALATMDGDRPERVLVVDDRREGAEHALRSHGRGPAAARNVGWRSSRADWVVFLDDDVLPAPGWADRLEADLRDLPPEVAASQGTIEVPLPVDRRPTDWERNVAGLERARWATADMAVRRPALAAVGGFDERFGRAYREDSDLGLRLSEAGMRLVRGSRRTIHPVGPAGPLKSLSLQRGNADDVLMRRLHGPHWRERAGAPPGRRNRHLATTAALAAALLTRRPWAAALWAAGSAELAWRRIAPGPRTPREVATMLATSLAMPPVATFWWARGHLRRPGPRPPAAVLLDRDGTLVEDVPYNGDPARVRPMPGAATALDRLREAGVDLAVVSNQSGIGRGLLSVAQVRSVNRRVEELLGPVGPWVVCPHAPEQGCECRKPEPGLVRRAAEMLGTEPGRCAVVGDIGADVEAARAAGARAVLVPTPRTRPEEVEAAPEVARDLEGAVDLLLGEAA